MPKLTDTQLVILSAAAQRNDGVLFPLPKSLKLNKGTLTAVMNNLLKQGLVSERPAGREEESWREHEGEKLTLSITEDGLRAVSGEPVEGQAPKPVIAKAQAKNKSRDSSAKAGKRSHARKPVSPKETKQALLIGLLKRRAGATIDEVKKVTGWQAHSVRGAISGTLKKKLGLKVESEAIDGRGRVYRIAAGR
jgi:hypothetical protein